MNNQMHLAAELLYIEAFKAVDMDKSSCTGDADYVAEMVEAAFVDAINTIEKGG